MRLHYREYGCGPPVIILHGLFGSLNNWHSHASRLGEFFHVFALDQRNHGASPHAAEMNYAAMADDLREFLADHHLAPVSLVGHSMGGKTAMQFALDYPGDVRKLVVVDIRPQGDTPHHDRIIASLQHVDFGAVCSREDVHRMLREGVPDEAERQFLATNLKRMENGTYAWKMNLAAIADHYAELIGSLTGRGSYCGPTLFIAGEKSAYIAEGDREGILERFPHARFQVIPGAGHWVHADSPEAFREAVTNFLL
jgi:pimeloyl-ACP methyl ester carboxylesterase